MKSVAIRFGVVAAIALVLPLPGLQRSAGAQILLEEKAIPEAESNAANQLRDRTKAPTSVLGDIGNGMAKAIEEGRDREAVRGAVITTDLKAGYAGKCPSSGYREMGKFDATYSNGIRGMVAVRCERGCWLVQTFPGAQSATNCGEFEKGAWLTPGRSLNTYGVTLRTVANFTLE